MTSPILLVGISNRRQWVILIVVEHVRGVSRELGKRWGCVSMEGRNTEHLPRGAPAEANDDHRAQVFAESLCRELWLSTASMYP
jgi:hypothetical protein